MKDLNLNALTKGTVLTRSKLRKITGRVMKNPGDDNGCQPGDTIPYEGPLGCGYHIIVIKLENGDCLYDEPHVQASQPCGFA